MMEWIVKIPFWVGFLLAWGFMGGLVIYVIDNISVERKQK